MNALLGFFLNMMLHFLRQIKDLNYIKLPDDFLNDLTWCNDFLHQYNCITYYGHRKLTLKSTSLLTGLGAVFGTLFYSLPLAKQMPNFHITQVWSKVLRDIRQ